jgi:hypothetical protein
MRKLSMKSRKIELVNEVKDVCSKGSELQNSIRNHKSFIKENVDKNNWLYKSASRQCIEAGSIGVYNFDYWTTCVASYTKSEIIKAYSMLLDIVIKLNILDSGLDHIINTWKKSGDELEETFLRGETIFFEAGGKAFFEKMLKKGHNAVMLDKYRVALGVSDKEIDKVHMDLEYAGVSETPLHRARIIIPILNARGLNLTYRDGFITYLDPSIYNEYDEAKRALTRMAEAHGGVIEMGGAQIWYSGGLKIESKIPLTPAEMIGMAMSIENELY